MCKNNKLWKGFKARAWDERSFLHGPKGAGSIPPHRLLVRAKGDELNWEKETADDEENWCICIAVYPWTLRMSTRGTKWQCRVGQGAFFFWLPHASKQSANRVILKKTAEHVEHDDMKPQQLCSNWCLLKIRWRCETNAEKTYISDKDSNKDLNHDSEAGTVRACDNWYALGLIAQQQLVWWYLTQLLLQVHKRVQEI